MDNPRCSDEISSSKWPKFHWYVCSHSMVRGIEPLQELDCSNSQRTLYITLPLIVIATRVGAIFWIEVLHVINIMGLATKFIT